MQLHIKLVLDFNQFEVVSFDCYGPLIDWESGILPALRQLLSSREIDLAKSQTRENRIWGDTAGLRLA
ncbi:MULTISPECIES: hypothetical protein [unclassified Microcoleus]|uniref:hypothetical protein n=1 Tax=unclassified Microcoleus TaxID=2642155 RepID=UPI002FD75C8A